MRRNLCICFYFAAFVLHRNRNAAALKRNPAARPKEVASFAFPFTLSQTSPSERVLPLPLLYPKEKGAEVTASSELEPLDC